MTQQKAVRNFEVVARVRPVSKEHETAVSAVDEHHVTVTVVPRNRKALVPKRGGRNQGVQPTQSYEFNSVLGDSATQADVCQAVDIDSKVRAALDGFPVLLFAFGQTSAGKTHTVVGSLVDKTEGNGVGERTLADNMPNEHSENNADHEGVMFTALRKGFVQAQQHKQREFEMSTSVVEIYNERAVDLLSNRQELQIRHRRVHGFYLEGLKRAVCSDVAEATEVLKRALAYRRSRAHQMNDSSSRSHAIITFHFDSWAAEGSAEAGEAAKAEQLFSLLKRARRAHANATSDASRGSSCNGSDAEPGPVAVPSSSGRRTKRRMRKYGQLVFVDLAGSERLKATGSHQGEGMNESCAINRSLFALGRVLHALSEKSKGRHHPVPVRDSTLTKILAHGLQYAAYTTMIACLNPMASQLGQSTSTLHFAKLALSIKTSPVATLDPRDKIVIDLKQKISSLRKENQSLTKAFLWLCSGTADWDTLIQQLPQHVTQQLPACAPPLLTPVPSDSSMSKDLLPVPTRGSCGPPTRPCTPAAPRPKTSQSISIPSNLPSDNACGTPPRTAPSRATSAVLATQSENAWPTGMPSSSVQEKLLQFPALAALESEFQALVSRPATAAEGELASIEAVTKVSNSACPVEPAVPSAAVLSLPSSKNMPGHDITPAAVRDALQGGSPGQFPNSRSSWPDCDDECCGEAGCSTGDGATPPSASPAHSMEANALLWAVGNLWFGVEQDMTSYAYTELQVHSRLEANGVEAASAGYYEQLSAEVQAAYPDKWKNYLSKGCMLNTMSRQQGIINTAVTVECALSNRAAWAESQVASNSCASVHGKTDLRSSWPRISSRRMSSVDESVATHTAMQKVSGLVPACLGKIQPRNFDIRGRSAGLHCYMTLPRAKSDSPCRPCATPVWPIHRPFSAGRSQTPGEQMRERIVSSLELGNATDVVGQSNTPLLKQAAGGMGSHTRRHSQQQRADMAPQHATPGGWLRANSVSSGHGPPHKRGWNDCPNPDIPRWRGRLCTN